MTSIIHRISCFVACPMKRKGKASRVRRKNRCRFPAGLICASGVKAVAAKSGGRIDRTRSMSRMSLECLRCIPLAASRVVSTFAPYRAFIAPVWLPCICMMKRTNLTGSCILFPQGVTRQLSSIGHRAS